MPARGFAGNHFGGENPFAGGLERSGNSSAHEGRKVDTTESPNTHDELMDFYFGEPTSSHKNTGGAYTSKW